MHHPLARDGRAGNADQHGREVGKDQFQVTFLHKIKRMGRKHHPVWRKTPHRQETPNHQEGLYCHARILAMRASWLNQRIKSGASR